MIYDLNKVKQAAKFLDENHPGWHKKIDTAKLFLKSPYNCILGQLYGGSGRAVINLCIEYREKYAFGYTNCINGMEESEAEKLKSKWIKQITKRLEK